MAALGRGLLKEFPNPNRIGCPGADVIKRIASHEMSLSEAEKWLDHLTSCSPCYGDFKRLQQARDWHRRRMLLAAAAGILLAVALVGWGLLRNRAENPQTQAVILDLSNRSLPRGQEANPTNEQPLELASAARNLTILLPLGSNEGPYDVRIVRLSGEALATTSGVAKLSDHITSLQVVVPLSRIGSGKYLLQIRRPESEWLSYTIIVK